LAMAFLYNVSPPLLSEKDAMTFSCLSMCAYETQVVLFCPETNPCCPMMHVSRARPCSYGAGTSWDIWSGGGLSQSYDSRTI
jgi:hypothetical protein